MTASSSSSFATACGPTQPRRTGSSSTINLSNDIVSASPAAAARASSSSSQAHTKEYSTELYDQNGRHDHPSSRNASPSKPSKLGSSNPNKHSTTASTPPPRRKSNMNVDKAEKRRSSRACLECRLAKTKCRVTDSQDVCDRCAKFSFECRFVRHHRGRKPVSKLASIDADDVDLGVGPSRFGASDDDMATDHDSDSANEDSHVKVDSRAANDDDDHAAERSDATRAMARDHDASAAGGESNQRKGREPIVARPGGSRSSSKARLHRAANSLHELDTNARRRIWEMLAQKIPQRGSTYTFVSKGEVAHDNLQASTSKSSSGKASSSGSKRASSPHGSSEGKDGDADQQSKVKAEDASAHAASASSQTASAPSQHFASTFRNLLRPVDKRAGATTAAEEAASAVTARYPRLPETLNLFGSKDPVDVGILSMAAAHRLYAYYFEHLNPWGMNFDPCFVSHDAVRVSSSFLYSTILYLASRYIELAEVDETNAEASAFYGATFARPRPDDDRVTATISARLGSHVRSLAITAFAMGDRRMETGVAMYLSSVWKEADDHFTILYCSYAAKIMSDIPTELLSLLPSSSSGSASRSRPTAKSHDDATSAANLQQQRLRRNQQRQFLFHFIQEHTHLLHFAPRPNFDRGPSLLRNLLAWADDALATEDDILLCADIDSVLLQTKYKSIMERAQTQEKDTLYGGSECFLLLQSFMDELEGWTSRWELQARKIDQRFRRHESEEGQTRGGEEEDAARKEKEDFAGHLPLDARMHLLKVMRSSLVMQISSIAFRASLRDINKVKPSAASGKSSSAGGAGAASSAFSPSALSAMDDRAEQIYYTCLDSALNLLVHTMQMPPSILRHAQDMIMVLAPHAALLATYLISLPLPSVPPAFSSSAAAAESRLSYEYAKVKTRIRRRKEYERKCLELMRDTRESFRVAQVRGDDHVGLCAQYFDSLLNVIEGENQEGEGGGARVGRSALGGSNVVAGTKRSRSVLEQSAGMGEEEETGSRGVVQSAVGDAGLERASSAGPASSRAPQSQLASSSTHTNHHHTPHRHQQHQPHHAANSNMDTSAAETLLNLHGTAEGSAETDLPNGGTTSPVASGKLFNGATSYYATHPLSRVAGGGGGGGGASGSTPPGFSPGSFISSGMFGHFAAGGGGPNSPLSHANHHQHQHHQQQQQYHSHGATGGSGSATGIGGYAGAAGAAGGEFGFATPPQGGNVLSGPTAAAGGTATPTGATGTSTPVDWTWLQSFLEVPEFSWM